MGAPLDLYNNPVNRFVGRLHRQPQDELLKARDRGRHRKRKRRSRSAAGTIRLPRRLNGATQGRTSHSASGRSIFRARGGIELASVNVEIVEISAAKPCLRDHAGIASQLTVALEGQQKVGAGLQSRRPLRPVALPRLRRDGRAMR
ncbi:hypothetical protein F2981_06555 [Sinorhizobium meliloti]|nr:hypothetical protein [Sinorhizobium meliloti]